MINVLFEYGASLFDSILAVFFITKFNHERFKNNNYWLPAILVIFVYTIISDKFLPGFNTLSTVLFLTFYVIYALIVSKKQYVRAILSAFIFEITLALLSSVIYLIISMLINDFTSALQGADNHVRHVYLVVHKVSLFAITKLILHVFKADESLDVKNGMLSFSFSLTTIIGLASVMYLSAIVHDNNAQFLVLIITVAFIFANVLLYILIGQLLKLQHNKYRVKLLEEKLEFERSKYNDATAIWTNIRKVQHDMKQHLTIIKGHLDTGEYDECRIYLQKLIPNDENVGNVIKSENKIIDYMINSKLGNLCDTEIVISGSIGDLSDIDELDLASLLGNILDNAVEAIEKVKEKRIELFFYRQNMNRVIICKNTINGSVLKTNKELKSTKPQGDSHGYGTSIVSKIVDKYNGLIEYYEEFDMFGVQICIPTRANNMIEGK